MEVLMAKADYLPQLVDVLDTWLGNFAAKLAIHAAALGLAPAVVTAITTAITNFRATYTAQVAAEATFKNAAQLTRTQKEVLISGTGGIRDLVQIIKHTSTYTLNIGEDLGIELDEMAVDKDTIKPTLLLFKLIDKKIRISFKKGIADGVIIKCRRATETEFTFLAKVIQSPHIDDPPNLTAMPEQRDYVADYFIGNAPVGLESDVVSIVV